jgi:hypothetical protein
MGQRNSFALVFLLMTTLELILVLASGIAATVTMTLFMYAYAAVFGKMTQVVHILGNMLTARLRFQSLDTKSGLVGTVFHFGVGVLFTLNYYLLWSSELISFSWVDGVILGIISGILAIIGWGFYLICHHHAPLISFKHYFTALFLAHMVFALSAVAVFKLYLPELS